MIYEYAIEPETVAKWGNISDYRFYCEKFGLGQPRLMSEYPKLKNWRRRVLIAAGGKDDMELQRITALIGLLSEKMIPRNVSTYDGNKEWLQNAEIEDINNSFRAIIARSNPRNHKNVLCNQALGLSSNPKWDIREQNIVPRSAYDMALVLRPILKKCNIAIFIDPYFMLNENEIDNWKKPFTALINELPKEKFSESSFQVEFHSSASAHKAPSPAEFKRRCEHHLAYCIPQGLYVNFKRWKQRLDGEKLHDRYLLTDIGGVDFSIGLAEGLKGETQKISLLKKETYEGIWERYMSKNPAFDLEEGEFTLPAMRK